MYTIQDIKKLLAPIMKKYSIKSAILFGSVAKNSATPQSDIDLLVDSGLKGIAFYGLLEEIVEKLNTKVDLIDVSQIEVGSKIEKEINSTGISIYG